MTRLRACLAGAVLVAAFTAGFAFSGEAVAVAANPNIAGQCGLHAGRGLHRDSGGTPYRFRLGARTDPTCRARNCEGHLSKPGTSSDARRG